MNAIILLNGEDVTNACLLTATRIAFDSSKRITTASITIMGAALGKAAQYDFAQYDVDRYSIALREMFDVTILDGRDGVTKLFDGQIYAMTLQQSDAADFTVFYQCDLNDAAAFLDRSVCWDPSFALTLPNSDQGIITALLGEFCPKIALTDIALIVPVIQSFEWVTKTCRQVLDDLSTLSMGSWRVDFDGNLHYFLAASSPPAPFGLSTSPDYVTTFPVKVDGYKHDFTNPVNRAYVRGNQDPETGVIISASYADPVSVGTYGEYATGVVDDQIVTGWDAALRAKSLVLANANPIETGSFTIWGVDGLQCGMQVHIREENIGIDGDYTIVALTMQWVDPSTVMYVAQFGQSQPDLETVLRMLGQRTSWQTANIPVATVVPGPPPDGSVTDASIAPGGLSASVINSVSASTIQGLINAGQIGSVNATTIIGQLQAGQIAAVNAGSIVGVLSATQIGSVNAGTIQGTLNAGQIGSVNATTIQGVIVSSQLADHIIDSLSKFATALTPIQIIKTTDPWPPTLPNANFPANSFFYRQADGHFYQVASTGLSFTVNDNPQGSLTSFFNIGAMNASSLIGLIVAAQIQSITAGQVTGTIQANQIGAVNASTIVGQLTATQIATVNANAIQGAITSAQIASVTAGQITGTIQANQIAAINATQITGTIAYTQIGSVNAATITIGQLNDSQISGMSGAKLSIGTVDSTKFTGFSIDVGAGTNLPARIRVLNGGATVAQMGYLGEVGSGNYGGWFQIFAAGGSGYSSAPVFTDGSGNLTINNARFTISASGYTVVATPTTFDASYGSLAIQVTGGSDMASLVSRGIVIYENGSIIGALVRDPSNSTSTELTLSGPGGITILGDGHSGTFRAASFQVGGSPGANGSFVAGTHTVTVVGGIITSIT